MSVPTLPAPPLPLLGASFISSTFLGEHSRHLYTLTSNDGGVEFTLVGGTVPEVLAEADGDPSSGFTARNEYVTDPSELGPLLDGEYYTFSPDTWGSGNTHNMADGDPSTVAQFIRDLDYVLGSNSSISLYVRFTGFCPARMLKFYQMFHGGTNFALGSGAIWKNYTAAFTTVISRID